MAKLLIIYLTINKLEYHQNYKLLICSHKKEIKIPIITEVMEEKFIPLISNVTDTIQIGSRNMQNYPFLTACAKTKKPRGVAKNFR